MQSLTEWEFDIIMQYSVEIPGYDSLYPPSPGLNLDRAIAYLWSGSPQFGSTTAAKRVRDSGGLRVNGEIHTGLKYTAVESDVERGYFTLGIGKRYLMPVGVMGTVEVRL